MAAYIGKMYLRLSLMERKWPEQKETKMEAMDAKSELRPNINFDGKL